MSNDIQDVIKQCCQGASAPVAQREVWRFEPCEKLTQPNVGFLMADTGSLMVSQQTYLEAKRLLGGTLPPSILLTEEAIAFRKALLFHRPPAQPK